MSLIKKKEHAYVLGAGPIGLITANELLKNGYNVTIFEKNNIVGGLCRTWKWDDFLVDTGPHIFHTPDQNLANYWEREFGDLFVKGDFWCQNVKGEKFNEYWDYPLSWESISKYPSNLKKNIIKELDSLNLDLRAKSKNYSEYIESFVGPTLKEMFFETYPKKIWGIPTNEMTPEWAPKRIEFRNKISPFYHKQWNAVGKYGTGCIYERIKEKILTNGGTINFDYTLNKIVTNHNRISSLIFSNNKKFEIKNNDIVISSLPINLTAKLLGYKSELKFRGIRSVYLAYKKKQIIPGRNQWFYYGDDTIYFNRITEPKKLSRDVAPNDKSYLTAEITFSKDDEIDLMDDKLLIDIIAKQVEKVGLIDKKELIDGSSNKEYFVYPLLYEGYQEELADTKAKIAKFHQLYSIGTGGDYNYADSQILFHKAFDTVSIICNKGSKFTQEIRMPQSVSLNKEVIIGNRKIGPNNDCYIIAEIGLNHNGNLELAKELIIEAKKCGCQAVKFQTFRADKRISKKVKSANYAEQIIGTEESLYETFERLSLSKEDHNEIFRFAREKNIEIFSTPFDTDSVDYLETLNVNAYKIASMDIVNLPLIKYVAQTFKPIILSTGMSTIGQIDEAVEAVRESGNKNLIILHCNSSYPAAPDEMNLKIMTSLHNYYNLPVGLSDHTIGLVVSQVALALGANVIERHFTLDRSFEGPDHILSSEPKELKELVSLSNKIPKIIGESTKRIQPNEYDTLNQQRKSIYAAVDINEGQKIDSNMITIKGPGGGLLPKYLEIVIGRIARTNIKKDFPINWENI